MNKKEFNSESNYRDVCKDNIVNATFITSIFL